MTSPQVLLHPTPSPHPALPLFVTPAVHCRLDGEDADEAVLHTRLLDAATDKLSKQLRALEGLALKVRSRSLPLPQHMLIFHGRVVLST